MLLTDSSTYLWFYAVNPKYKFWDSKEGGLTAYIVPPNSSMPRVEFGSRSKVNWLWVIDFGNNFLYGLSSSFPVARDMIVAGVADSFGVAPQYVQELMETELAMSALSSI